MTLSGNGSPDERFPVFTATWLGDWVVPPPGTGVTIAGVAGDPDGTIRLTAAPSVTRDGAWILLSRPPAGPADVRIHDVTGRLVRFLRGTAGGDRVQWDGRTAAGAPAPAGVYFVRLAGGASAPARVVRIR
jgi:hypothetical protein